MSLLQLMQVAMLITGLQIESDALVYYNEFVDYVLKLYPHKISKPYSVKVDVRDATQLRYKIPSQWACVLKIKNMQGKILFCDIVDDEIFFPGNGEYTIMYTVKPSVNRSIEEPLEHHRDLDLCIPYYFAWKMCERDQLSANRVQKFQMLFYEYLRVAVKTKARQRLRYIKAKPL